MISKLIKFRALVLSCPRRNIQDIRRNVRAGVIDIVLMWWSNDSHDSVFCTWLYEWITSRVNCKSYLNRVKRMHQWVFPGPCSGLATVQNSSTIWDFFDEARMIWHEISRHILSCLRFRSDKMYKIHTPVENTDINIFSEIIGFSRLSRLSNRTHFRPDTIIIIRHRLFSFVYSVQNWSIGLGLLSETISTTPKATNNP